jgi:hypothetical protein
MGRPVRSVPEKIYAAKEIKELIDRQARELSPELQQAYRLRAINGLPGAESRRVLGIPPRLSEPRSFRARRKRTNALRESAWRNTVWSCFREDVRRRVLLILMRGPLRRRPLGLGSLIGGI